MLIKAPKNKENTRYFAVLSMLVLIIILSFQSLDRDENQSTKPAEVTPSTGLKLIQVELKEKHYIKLKKKRDNAASLGVLITSDQDEVPAIVHFGDKRLEASIRLKGDWTDHLDGEKWSFRIKLKGENSILGMKKFSIHHPRTRGYVYEWLYHRAIKDAGLIGLRYDFLEGMLMVKSKTNSGLETKKLGVYALEEHFDKRLLENNRNREGVILKMNESYLWNERASALDIAWKAGDRSLRGKFETSNWPYFVTAFGLQKILEDDNLNKQFTQGKNLLYEYRANGNSLKVSEVFDVKKLAAFTVLTNLFGAYHNFTWQNQRIYYNPITSLLEPISFDGNSGQKLNEFAYYNRTKDDTEFKEALLSAMEKYASDEYLVQLVDKYKPEIDEFEKELISEFGKGSIFKPEILAHNQKVIYQTMEKLKVSVANK